MTGEWPTLKQIWHEFHTYGQTLSPETKPANFIQTLWGAEESVHTEASIYPPFTFREHQKEHE